MFSERFKELKTAYNYTSKQIMDGLKISKQTVSNWENNNVLPSIDMLMKTAAFFNVTTDYMLGLSDRKYIEVLDLTDSEIARVQMIINDISKNKK